MFINNIIVVKIGKIKIYFIEFIIVIMFYYIVI